MLTEDPWVGKVTALPVFFFLSSFLQLRPALGTLCCSLRLSVRLGAPRKRTKTLPRAVGVCRVSQTLVSSKGVEMSMSVVDSVRLNNMKIHIQAASGGDRHIFFLRVLFCSYSIVSRNRRQLCRSGGRVLVGIEL